MVCAIESPKSRLHLIDDGSVHSHGKALLERAVVGFMLTNCCALIAVEDATVTESLSLNKQAQSLAMARKQKVFPVPAEAFINESRGIALCLWLINNV